VVESLEGLAFLELFTSRDGATGDTRGFIACILALRYVHRGRFT